MIIKIKDKQNLYKISLVFKLILLTLIVKQYVFRDKIQNNNINIQTAVMQSYGNDNTFFSLKHWYELVV